MENLAANEYFCITCIIRESSTSRANADTPVATIMRNPMLISVC